LNGIVMFTATLTFIPGLNFGLKEDKIRR